MIIAPQDMNASEKQ